MRWVVKEVFMLVSQSSLLEVRWRFIWLCLSTCLLLSSFILVSCSGVNVGSSAARPTAKPTIPQVSLSKLHWCNKPFIIFRDEHAPFTLTPGGGTSSPTAGPTKVPVLLCTGVKDSTSIVFSRPGSEQSLKQFFDALQPNVTWVPGA